LDQIIADLTDLTLKKEMKEFSNKENYFYTTMTYEKEVNNQTWNFQL